MARKSKKSAWTDERRARFSATVAAKNAAKKQAAAAPEPRQSNGNDHLALTINGRSYPATEAFAIHHAVEELLTLRSAR